MEVNDMQPLENTQETPGVMYISLNQAAKLWGKSKGTISKLASSGKLQWHDQPNGERKLFLPELSQRFGPPLSEQQKQVAKQGEVTDRQPPVNTGNAHENSRLEAELTAAREMIETLREQMNRERELLADQVARERQNADAWRTVAQEAQQMMKALPAPAIVKEQAPEPPAPRKLTWFERLTGKVAA